MHTMHTWKATGCCRLPRPQHARRIDSISAGFRPYFGDMTLWNTLASCAVRLYTSPYPYVTNVLLWAPDAPWPHSQHRWKEEPAFISTPATTVLTCLLPDATLLRLEACAVDDTTAQITLRVQSTQT